MPLTREVFDARFALTQKDRPQYAEETLRHLNDEVYSEVADHDALAFDLEVTVKQAFADMEAEL